MESLVVAEADLPIDEVNGPALGLLKKSAYIFTEHSHADELGSHQE